MCDFQRTYTCSWVKLRMFTLRCQCIGRTSPWPKNWRGSRTPAWPCSHTPPLPLHAGEGHGHQHGYQNLQQLTLKSTLSRRSAWHCWRRRSKRRRAPLIMGLDVEIGLLCIGRFDFKGLKGSKGQPGPGRGRNTHLRPLNKEHHLLSAAGRRERPFVILL